MITIEKQAEGVSEKSLVRFAKEAKKAVGLKGDISVLITSSAVMRRLNRSFRGKDKPTDVISFPAVQEVGNDFAGDLAISVDIARANARRFGHDTEDELRVLILHGLLHLAGHDHETDKGEMARKEARLRSQLGLPSNLIARTSGEGKNGTGSAGKTRRGR